MLFKLTNKRANRSTHCGVLEFVADEGKAFIPHWVGVMFYSPKMVAPKFTNIG